MWGGVHQTLLRGSSIDDGDGHTWTCGIEDVGDRACEICAKTRTEWRWPYVIGSERASGHGGTCGIEDVWVRVGSCVWRAYGCTEHAKTTMCGIASDVLCCDKSGAAIDRSVGCVRMSGFLTFTFQLSLPFSPCVGLSLWWGMGAGREAISSGGRVLCGARAQCQPGNNGWLRRPLRIPTPQLFRKSPLPRLTFLC